MAMKLDHEDLNRLIEKISKSDIQEFSLEGEDFKLEIKRNLFDQNQVTNNLVSNTSVDKQTIANQKPIKPVSYTNFRAHKTAKNLLSVLRLEKTKQK